MQSENWPESADLYRYLAGNGVVDVGGINGMYGFPANCYDFPMTTTTMTMTQHCQSGYNGGGASFYGPSWEVVSGITETSTTTTTTAEERALVASKNHKEAEKRRRQKINSHLDKLRTLLPCNSKTDKASLLAKVIQRVKELKQQTSELNLETFPSETDEISVQYSNTNKSINDGGRLLIKASLCCEDRSDLIPDLIETLRSLRLNPLTAEMATLGGRTRNVLVVAGNEDQSSGEVVQFLRDALKSLVHRSSSSSDLKDRSKRRRVFDSSPTIA
ncbi:putative transcription factor bHLH107 [Camellia lanceoleosa]|uniref:Transcription factor bHLH107 n=1 Tax=Camellia lanceoleosa TaxID=1840588 RepID=A0ACC0FNS7_9ERIC|nr:putative transcription factor bHLH107 [Camellia lanceoleosa]